MWGKATGIPERRLHALPLDGPAEARETWSAMLAAGNGDHVSGGVVTQLHRTEGPTQHGFVLSRTNREDELQAGLSRFCLLAGTGVRCGVWMKNLHNVLLNAIDQVDGPRWSSQADPLVRSGDSLEDAP